jgi:AcrR family transcriptional regulator
MPEAGEHRVTKEEGPTPLDTSEAAPGGDTNGAPQRERLTRARIVRTALGLMDAEGLEAVTMRRVGRELGVEAMSLYNHVRDKEDLLDAITEAVLAEFRWEPATDDWMELGRAAAREWRRVVRAHPNVIRLMIERKHPLTSVDALRPTEIALELLRRAGLSERDTANAFQAFGGYIFGVVMMELGNLAPGRAAAWEALPSTEIGRSLPSDFPCLTEMLPWMMACDPEATFELGLDLLLEGIRARAATPSEA